MTQTRILTGLISLPIVFLLIQWGGWVFSLVVSIIALAATWEYVRMMQKKAHTPALVFAFAIVLAAMANIQFPAQSVFVPSFTGIIMALLVWELFRAESTTQPIDWAITVAGSAYIGLGLSHLLGLRLLPEGHAWVWVAIAGTWGADSAAYFGGRALGKRKFWPRWSPKKTWEGIIAGIFGGMLGCLLVTLVYGFPWQHALIIGVFISLVGPLGDLSVSMLKRYAGVKDSSQLIPGHGGVLDRIDSLLFAAVTVFYYAVWVFRA